MYLSIEYLNNTPTMFVTDFSFETFLQFNTIGSNANRVLDLSNLTQYLYGIACL